MKNAENAARVHTHTHTHTHTGTLNKRIKSNKGSITSFTLLSMMFFLIVVVAIYASVNTKIQKQQKELNSIQKSYEQEKIDDIYQKKYNEYLEKETSTIQVYADTILKGEVIGKNKNTIGTVYTDVVQNKIKIFGGANSTYAYSETADGKRNVLSGNEITIQATTSGKTIYTWLKGEDGKYTKYYTAVTVKLSTLQDKTIYVAEGKTTDIGEISGQNKGKITYSQIDANYVSIENDKVTGIKAGDTTIIATESNGGAQAKITIKIVKLTLEKTKGITTVGDNKKIQVSGINNGTISAKSNDETIAKVTVNGTEVTVIPQNVGNAKIIITENNAGANIEYEIQVVGITLAPNGGTYTMPTTGKATIRTKVKVENASKIEVAWTSAKLEWKTIENNSETIKNDCEKGTYYLYVKIDNEYLYQSQAFIVGEEKIAIAIKTSTTTWTNQNITVTITYPSVTTSSTRKAGYGTTLANAQTAATSATAPTTSVTVTANGYVYATATDTAGNVITASRQITNIDKTAPEISEFSAKASTTISTSATITVKAKDGLSGLSNLVLEWGTNTNYGNKKSESCLINGKGATDLTTKTISLTDLSANTTYYVKITISDVSGNVKTSTSSFTTGKAIAETNNVLYTSIQNALDSIEKQGTVKVLSDTTENVNIDTEKTITVNLNSKHITGVLKNWGTTTVYGGNITENSENVGHAIENYGGKLKITSGTYRGYYQGVYQPKVDGIAETGEIIIEGGNYYGGFDGVCICVGSLNIENGYFEGEHTGSAAIDYSENLSISGGKFYGKTIAGVYTSGCDNLYITNGYFKGSESSGIASYYTKYVNISNGEFVGYNNGIYMHDGTTATISGGKFSGYLSGLAIRNSTVTITEGTFTGDTVDALSLYKSTGEIKGGVFTGKLHGGYNNNGSFTITGGKFRGNVEDGFYNENGTLYIDGGNFSGYKWGINSPSGKIWYRRTDGQTSDNNYVSSEGWPAVTASDLSFY